MFCVICHVLVELSYTFEHIWTNLLTQCTQLPVAVFCCFCISGFPAIKSAPKIPEKSDTKSALWKLPAKSREGRGATTRRPKGSLAWPHPRPRQGASWLTGGSPWCPPSPIFTPRGETPKSKPFFPDPPSVPPPPPFQDRGCLEKLLRHPAGRRNPLRETIHIHGRLPDVP